MNLNADGRSVRVRVILASVIIALQVAFPALILILSLSDSSSESGPSHSVMVVRYACMACQCCPTGTYFTTYQAAAVHYARSTACHQSLRGIATVVLPNRPADAEAGGCGAAGGWAGPSKLAGGPTARPRPSMTGACTTYHIRFSDMYRMSRIVYDIVFTVYDIVKKSAFWSTTSHRYVCNARVH